MQNTDEEQAEIMSLCKHSCWMLCQFELLKMILLSCPRTQSPGICCCQRYHNMLHERLNVRCLCACCLSISTLLNFLLWTSYVGKYCLHWKSWSCSYCGNGDISLYKILAYRFLSFTLLSSRMTMEHRQSSKLRWLVCKFVRSLCHYRWSSGLST